MKTLEKYKRGGSGSWLTIGAGLTPNGYRLPNLLSRRQIPPPAPSGRHAQTGKEGRHASRVDLIRRLAREGPPRRFTGTGARVMTTQM